MSLWFRRKNADGKTYYYLVPFTPVAIFALIGVFCALMVSVIQAIRTWLGE